MDITSIPYSQYYWVGGPPKVYRFLGFGFRVWGLGFRVRDLRSGIPV